MSTSSVRLTMCSSFTLLTWSYHISRFSVILLDSCTTLVVPIVFISNIILPCHSAHPSQNFLSHLYRPSPLLCGPVVTIIFQYCLFSVMSAVSSYLVLSSRLLSVHLRSIISFTSSHAFCPPVGAHVFYDLTALVGKAFVCPSSPDNVLTEHADTNHEKWVPL